MVGNQEHKGIMWFLLSKLGFWGSLTGGHKGPHPTPPLARPYYTRRGARSAPIGRGMVGATLVVARPFLLMARPFLMMARSFLVMARPFLLIVGMLAFSIAPASAFAQTLSGGDGRIYGRLLDGSKNSTPLAGQMVTLQVAQLGNGRDLATAKTDAHGNYNFPNLSTDKTLNYAVYIRYQGAQYISDLVTLDSRPVQQVNLTVYDATTSASKIAIVDATILIHAPDAQKGLITISEFFDFQNLDRYTYVGSLDASKGRPNALLFSLPLKAQHVSLSQGFSGYNVIQVDRGFASDVALPPGDSQFAFSFVVPYSSTSYDFSYTAFYPTVSVSMLVPPDIQANSALLSSQGLITADQHPYRLFKATGLLPNQGFHVSLNGLHLPDTVNVPAPLNTTTIWLVAALLLMCAIVVVTWFLYRSQRNRASRKKRAAEATRKTEKAGRGAAAEKTERGEASTGRQQVLLQELLELDKAYEEGNISKADYQARRLKAKARLRAILREQETARR
jgi:hypothetical protein